MRNHYERCRPHCIVWKQALEPLHKVPQCICPWMRYEPSDSAAWESSASGIPLIQGCPPRILSVSPPPFTNSELCHLTICSTSCEPVNASKNEKKYLSRIFSWTFQLLLSRRSHFPSLSQFMQSQGERQTHFLPPSPSRGVFPPPGPLAGDTWLMAVAPGPLNNGRLTHNHLRQEEDSL